ncbi:hypothetical protein ACQUY5_09685 [Bacillus cereus]|uniref:hypothetical protein n=1 Tax=Bacillus cereus TaxID=1396 RepID=UPI003D184CD2
MFNLYLENDSLSEVSYEPQELATYAIEDFSQFISQSLNPAQATSRVLVEYRRQLKSEKMRIVIYLALFVCGNKYEYQREDIVEELQQFIGHSALNELSQSKNAEYSMTQLASLV